MAKLYENSEFAERYENASVLKESALLESLSEVDKRYKSIEEIGRGGMKRIVRAMDSFTNREVALATLKTIDSETDIKNGKLSVNSPIGKGLLGKSVGEIAEIKVPNGIMNFEIIEISR